MNKSSAGTGIWNDNDNFNELSQEADEALRGRYNQYFKFHFFNLI
jgi:hypothetical protein